jgi:hypothetical protein
MASLKLSSSQEEFEDSKGESESVDRNTMAKIRTLKRQIMIYKTLRRKIKDRARLTALKTGLLGEKSLVFDYLSASEIWSDKGSL